MLQDILGEWFSNKTFTNPQLEGLRSNILNNFVKPDQYNTGDPSTMQYPASAPNYRQAMFMQNLLKSQAHKQNMLYSRQAQARLENEANMQSAPPPPAPTAPAPAVAPAQSPGWMSKALEEIMKMRGLWTPEYSAKVNDPAYMQSMQDEKVTHDRLLKKIQQRGGNPIV